MNIDRLRVAVLIAVLLPNLAFAQPGGLAEPDVRALVGSLPQGPEFRSDRQVYRPVAELRAYPRGAGSGDIVTYKGPYVIVRAGSTARSGATAAEPGVTAGSVVVNVRTGQLGIADGTITAKLSDVGAAEALAAANGLTVEFVAGAIGHAFFTAPPGRDLAAAATALAKDPRVQSAYPGVRESFAVPN